MRQIKRDYTPANAHDCKCVHVCVDHVRPCVCVVAESERGRVYETGGKDSGEDSGGEWERLQRERVNGEREERE